MRALIAALGVIVIVAACGGKDEVGCPPYAPRFTCPATSYCLYQGYQNGAAECRPLGSCAATPTCDCLIAQKPTLGIGCSGGYVCPKVSTGLALDCNPG